jgi:hypothetical protein
MSDIGGASLSALYKVVQDNAAASDSLLLKTREFQGFNPPASARSRAVRCTPDLSDTVPRFLWRLPSPLSGSLTRPSGMAASRTFGSG